MTLTNDDLQAIGTIIDQKLKPIKEDIQQVQKLNSVIDQKLKPIKEDIQQIKKITATTAKLLDLEQMRQRKQIKRIEEHFQLPSYS